MAAPDFYNVAPDCIHHGLPPGNPFSAENAAPFVDCVNGFFTFGPGTAYYGGTGVFPEGDYALGDVVHSASTALYLITVIGFVVSIAFIIAWVWVEHRKLMDRTEMLQAAARPRVGETGPPGMTE